MINFKDIGFKSVLITWLLVGIVFCLNPPWFIWDYSYALASVFVLSLFFLCFNRILLYPMLFANHLLLFIVCVLFFVVFGGMGEFRLSSVVTLLTFFLLFFISEDEKIKTLKLITNILAVVILVSLTAWLTNKYIFKLPMYGYLEYGKGKGDAGDILLNYILFIDYSSDTVSRFYSVFDEPGVLGTLSAFILFANKYNFRKRNNIIILIGGLFTFSLAFILISMIGMMILNVKRGLAILKAALGLVILLGLTFLVLKEDETFNAVVVDRIVNIGEFGVDSRTSEGLNYFFNNFISSSDFYLGLGTDFFNQNPTLLEGQGYKIFVIEYGLAGIVILFFMYKSFFKQNYILGYSCLAIFFLSFLQRPFLFTPWQLIMFSLAIVNLTYLENNLKQIDKR